MIRKAILFIVDKLKKLNVYASSHEDTAEESQNQIIATRVFCLLFIVSLTGLVGYASLSYQLTIVQIHNPDETTFERLHSKYSDTLVCPCSQTSIAVDRFLTVDVTYHQICSSMFVSDEWISSISPSIPTLFYSLDIRRMISSQLQLIASQCHLSIVAVRDALKTLASNQLFISAMLSRDLLNSQMDFTVDDVKKDVIAEQRQGRQLIEVINQQNQLASGLSTSHLYQNINYTNQQFYLVKFLKNQTYPPTINFTQYTDSQLCFCSDALDCTYPAGIYSSLTGDHSYMYQSILIPPKRSDTQIPGLKVGCMPFISIMESTLECFYSNDCLFQLFSRTNQTALSNSTSSQFPSGTKVGSLVEQLFLENISSRKNFSAFFQACQPNTCTYSYNSRGQIAFIIATVLSLVGGLSVALKIFATLLVTIYRMIEKRFQKTTSTISFLVATTNQNDSKAFNKKSVYVRKAFARSHERITGLNLFKSYYNDAIGRRNEIIMTRFYVLLMAIGLIAIVFYASFVEHTLTYHVKSPSLSTYRQMLDQYPDFSCECTRISAAYSVFLKFAPKFHQVCASIFISDAFVPRYDDNQRPFALGKFLLRLAVPSYYASGRAICDLIETTSSQAIGTFLQTIYVSSSLTNENEFQSRMKSVIDNFQALAPTTFTHLLQLIQETTQGNQLLSSTFTNAKLQYTQQNEIDILWINPNDESCNCGMSSSSCAFSYAQYCNYTFMKDTGVESTCFALVPGLMISCYLIDGSLISTIECLYDTNCTYNSILALSPDVSGALLAGLSSIVLNKNLPSRFQPNSTMGYILGALGIEDWNAQIKYALYYNYCNPVNCLYTITKKFNIPTVVTTVIGLIGGLSIILRILIPPAIKFLRYHRTQLTNVRMAWQGSRFDGFIPNIRQVNLFTTAETENSSELRNEQIITTRLYIVFWITSVTILSIYTGLSQKTTRVLVKSPSIDDVHRLQSTNLNEFSCPCSKITIPFGTFTSLNYTLHEICSSDFISELWLQGLFSNSGSERSVGRGVFSSHFQLLRSFCHSSNQTLFDATTNFDANQFITVKLLTPNEFRDQIQTLIADFQNRTSSSFRRNLALIVDITLGNQFMSVYATNWHFIPDPDGTSAIYTQSRTYQSGNCSCGTSRSLYCIDPLVIIHNVSVPGMFIGCLPLTSLRFSSLECFYDQMCLDEIKQAMNLTNHSIKPLNTSRSDQFPVNRSLSEIIDNLMLRQWINTNNYSAYFHQCQPTQCTYSMIEQNNLLVVFTTLLGLYGGLTVVLKFIAPTIVTIGRKVYNKCRSNRRTVPQSFAN